MTIPEWLSEHWIELSSALGIGGTSGFLSKKILDKKQSEDIESLFIKVGNNEKAISDVKKDIGINTLLDNQFREQVKEERQEIRETLKEIKDHQDKIFEYLLNKK